MSTIKPTKAQLFNGLRRRPKYEEISQEINPDETKIKYPNRNAKFLREDPRMTQLDGIGFFESMQDQEEATIKEQRKESTLRQIAKDNNTGMAEARANYPPKPRTTEFFDIGHDDAHMQTEEVPLEQAVTGSKILNKVRLDKMKEKIRTRFVKIKTQESAIMKPGTSEMGSSTDHPTKVTPIETQTDAPPVVDTNPLHLNQKTKNKVQKQMKEEKVKKERKKRALKEELKEELKKEEVKNEIKDEVMKKDIPKREVSRSRGRGRPKKEEPKDEVKDEMMKKETKEEKRGRSRSRKAKEEPPKPEPKTEEQPKTVKRTKSKPPEQKEEKKIKTEPAVTPEPKAKAKAKARAKSVDNNVQAGSITLNNNTGRDYWKEQSANEIRNQLRLRKVPQDDWIFKDKAQLIGIIVKVIKASNK